MDSFSKYCEANSEPEESKRRLGQNLRTMHHRPPEGTGGSQITNSSDGALPIPASIVDGRSLYFNDAATSSATVQTLNFEVRLTQISPEERSQFRPIVPSVASSAAPSPNRSSQHTASRDKGKGKSKGKEKEKARRPSFDLSRFRYRGRSRTSGVFELGYSLGAQHRSRQMAKLKANKRANSAKQTVKRAASVSAARETKRNEKLRQRSIFPAHRAVESPCVCSLPGNAGLHRNRRRTRRTSDTSAGRTTSDLSARSSRLCQEATLPSSDEHLFTFE